MKNVIILGYGSIGKRHANNLDQMGFNVFVWNRSKIKEKTKKINFIYDLKKILEKSDIVFICLPSNLHYKYLKFCLDKNKHIYVEKPFCLNTKEIKKITKHQYFKKVVIQDGCQLRSDPLIKKIKKIIEKKELGKILYYKGYVGQHLNMWRNKKGKESYSAYKSLGGGVHYDLIHDLDLAIFLLGKLEITYELSKKLSNLTIDSKDFCHLVCHSKLKKIPVLITLDMLNPNYKRSLEIIGNKGSVKWSDEKKIITLSKFKNFKTLNKKYTVNYLRNDVFLNNIKLFMSKIQKKQYNKKNQFKDIYNSINILEGIK